MRLKKLLKLLKEATNKHSSVYTKDELEYMKSEIDSIESEMNKIKHLDYRGFGNK